MFSRKNSLSLPTVWAQQKTQSSFTKKLKTIKRIILLLFVLTTIASTSCKKNLDYQDPSDKSIDQEIVSLNKQFKDLLERVNPTIRKTPITPKEMENIDDFESTVYSFVRKHTGNSRKTRSTEDFHPEEYLDNPEKLLVDIKERGVTEEFDSK